MKKIVLVLSVLFGTKFSGAQNIGIGTNTPNANAVLDISSTNKGLLIPRMDSTTRKNIANTIGLMVYDTNTKCFWYNDGTRWVNMPPKGSATGDVLYWNGAAWTVLPAGQGGQYLSLTPGTLVPAWATINTGGGSGNSITISTQNITSIAPTTAVCGGSIAADGGAAITARGVVWSTSTNPTIALTTKTNDGTGIGGYTSNLTGLTAATTYYVRAYATNVNGTSYGNQVSFSTVSNFTIGQTYGGGIIFYIDGTGQHGLIASPEDLSTEITWRNISIANDILTNASGLAIGTGSANTNAIITAQGNGSYAASLCRDFYTGGGFTDWYLPSLYELNQMFSKKTEVGFTPVVGPPIYYWSSSEVSQQEAYMINFNTQGTNQANYSKGYTGSVRAVRKF
jgi:hypothetical protein